MVATAQATAGRGAHDGKELLIAADPRGFASAIQARALLRARRDPARVAQRLACVYAEVTRAPSR